MNLEWQYEMTLGAAYAEVTFTRVTVYTARSCRVVRGGQFLTISNNGARPAPIGLN